MADLKKYLRKEKYNPMKKTVLELSKNAGLTTAELLSCVESGTKTATLEEIREMLYKDLDTTYKTLADEVQLHHIPYPVLQAIGNLYLNNQISFQQF